MKLGIPIFLGIFLALSGCEKLKSLKNSASSAPPTAAPSSVVDPALAKLVLRENDGVVFRQDLPFPANLRVDVTKQMSGKYSGYKNTELGKMTLQNQPISSRSLITIERMGEHVRYTVGMEAPPPATSTPPAAKPTGKSAATPAPPPPKVALVLRHTTGKWKADPTSDFRAKTQALDLEKSFAAVLAVGGAAPLKEWLPRRPFKPGDEIVLENARLALVDSEFHKGRITLRYEGEEAVGEHPCGVFRSKGDASGNSADNTEMPGAATDMTIEDGRIWFSLLYPIVMRSEYSAITTVRSSGARINGSKKVEETKTWKPDSKQK